jgi:hypothetical protein
MEPSVASTVPTASAVAVACDDADVVSADIVELDIGCSSGGRAIGCPPASGSTGPKR